MKSILRALCLFACMFVVVGCASSGGDFAHQDFTFSGEKRTYAVYKPKDYNPTKSYPTILFLHGLFESGNDGKANTGVGIGPAIAKHPDWYHCVVVFAQTSSSWRDDDQLPLAMATLDDAQKHYAIDPNRVVVTGLSTGGHAVWKLGAEHPERFAALAPLCAYSDYDDVGRLTHYPIWAFHNRYDMFVMSSSTDDMCEKINDAGGNARKTIYTAIGHDCWDRAYDDEKFALWLQNQHR